MKRWLALALVLVLLLSGCGEIRDGSYTVKATLEGGSGRAYIESAAVEIQNGEVTASITWSSPYYDYMILDGIRYEPVNTEGNSVFVIPARLDEPMAIQADTVAMSQPYLIDYTLTLDSSTLKEP